MSTRAGVHSSSSSNRDTSTPSLSSDIGASDSPSSLYSYTGVWGWAGGANGVQDVGPGVGVVRGVRIDGARLENRGDSGTSESESELEAMSWSSPIVLGWEAASSSWRTLR